MDFSTLCIHSGYKPDCTGSVSAPIYTSTAYLLLIGKLRNSCSLKAEGKRNRGLDNHAKSNCRDVRRC